MVIRHIVLLKLNEHATPELLDRIDAELRGLDAPGRINFEMGRDLGLRDGNMDLAITNDFETVEDYKAYDHDDDHERIRHAYIHPITERAERVQFTLR